MPLANNLPPEYAPYERVVLCGNTLRGVQILFKIGAEVPLLVGKSESHKPNVWLAGRVGPISNSNFSWLELVESSRALQPSIPWNRVLMVVSDIKEPKTLVLVGSELLLSATELDADSVAITALDLRLVGLNIFGNEADGLKFAGSKFAGNSFTNVGVAFAVPEISGWGPPAPAMPPRQGNSS